MAHDLDEVVFPLPLRIAKPGWFRLRRGLLSARQCEELLHHVDERGRFYASRSRRIKRDVAICYLAPEEAPRVFEKLATAIVRENVWGFALAGIVEPMRIQRYEVGGYTRPHSDYDYASEDQSKVTAIVPLVPRSSWSGGRLSIAGRTVAARLERGDCLLFPSFAWHAVTPVTRGTRTVLSAWAAGPRLR